MAGPTPSWNTVPVYGTWLQLDGTPVHGKVMFTLPQRITNAPGDVIFPRNGVLEFSLGAETGTINFDCPILDDPDNFPDDDSVVIRVDEIFIDAVNATYYIRPTAAMADNDPPGLDLRTLIVNDGTPAVPPASLLRGVPGGVAALDADGNVLDADGDIVGGVGGITGISGGTP